MSVKTCTKCKKEKTLNEFYLSSRSGMYNGKILYENLCKKCRQAHQKATREAVKKFDSQRVSQQQRQIMLNELLKATYTHHQDFYKGIQG